MDKLESVISKNETKTLLCVLHIATYIVMYLIFTVIEE